MSFSYYLNMEQLSLQIAKQHILNMTDTIYCDDVGLDWEKSINNIQNGFVVVTQLNCYIESFLNTIINACIGYDKELLLKCSIDEKIELIFMHYNKSFDEIKGQHTWGSFRKTQKIRNEMIHFKKTYIGDGTEIPNFELGRQNVADFFTKGNMQKTLQEHVALAKSIANTLGLRIYESVEIFQCDGMDDLVNYVYDPNKVHVDDFL